MTCSEIHHYIRYTCTNVADVTVVSIQGFSTEVIVSDGVVLDNITVFRDIFLSLTFPNKEEKSLNVGGGLLLSPVQ